ncbi:MAG: hypothetical protein IGS38_08265 [Synechococcales cyanobacterium M58_A2018_015]|nr:hypothetical protein [Synechococcales cyanobacterium M58_A2018_015]
MQGRTVWQQGSSDPTMADTFATLSQWWASLNGKEITWQQRILPETGTAADLNWEPQRFDETFSIGSPEVRGITLYWRKPDSPDERSITVHKLELDPFQQHLYVYPQSQRNVVIRVGLPQVVYQQVKLTDPQFALTETGGQSMLTIRDEKQRLELQISLSPETLGQLRQQLGK